MKRNLLHLAIAIVLLSVYVGLGCLSHYRMLLDYPTIARWMLAISLTGSLFVTGFQIAGHIKAGKVLCTVTYVSVLTLLLFSQWFFEDIVICCGCSALLLLQGSTLCQISDEN